MITDVDVKKLEKKFVTKNDLSKVTSELVEYIQAVRIEFKNDIKNTSQDLKKELKNDIVDFKNSILNEIIKLREDIEVVIGYRDMIEDHDQRIEKLETAVYQ